MGWPSYLEDIVKRFEQVSTTLDRFSPEQPVLPDYQKQHHDLLALRRDVKAYLNQAQQIMEILSDPEVDVYEKWQETEDELKQVRLESRKLRHEITRLHTDYKQKLKEYQIEVGTLRAKLINERRESKLALKRANQK